MKYDFSLLTDIEFEELINNLVQESVLQKVVERYSQGKDGGVDGRVYISHDKSFVIQSKHYLKSGFAKLKRVVQNEEVSKVFSINPKEYILATSLELTPSKSDELRDIIRKKNPSTNVHIWGYETIAGQLDLSPKVFKATIKLWAQNVALLKQFISPVEESLFICLQSRWSKLDKYFVPFAGIKNFIERLEKEHVLIISGEPGIGKTTLAEYICKRYFADGYKIVIVNESYLNNRMNILNPEEKTLFLYDDFLGSNYANSLSGNNDRQLVEFLKEVQRQKNKRFVLTSRTNIINLGCAYSQYYQNFHLEHVAIPMSVLLLDKETKARILYNHLWHSSIDENDISELVKRREYHRILNHRNFNPRLIEFITDRFNYKASGTQYLNFVFQSLDNPEGIWNQCYTREFSDVHRILIKLVVMNRGRIEEEKLKAAYDDALELFGLSSLGSTRHDYEHILKICENTLIKRSFERSLYPQKDKFFIEVFNPSVSDFVIPLINNKHEILKLFRCLHTIECVNFAKAQKFSNEILKEMLKLCDECDTVKLQLIAILIDSCYTELRSIIEELPHKSLTDWNNSSQAIYTILMKSLNDVDWSACLKNHLMNFKISAQQCKNLSESYKKTPFFLTEVEDLIHRRMVKALEEEIPQMLWDDSRFIESESDDDGYARLDSIIEDIANDYSDLTEDECSSLYDSVDIPSMIEEIIRDRNSEYNQYDDEDYYIRNHNNDLDIDNLFGGLFNR